MNESLCYTLEMKTILYISHISIKKIFRQGFIGASAAAVGRKNKKQISLLTPRRE